MNSSLKKILFAIGSLLALIILSFWILAYIPMSYKLEKSSITPEKAVELRAALTQPYHTFESSDGETLFLRRWNPDSLATDKEDIALLIFHGITAHSGAYNRAAEILSAGGYTTFGLDYRGHGLSSGNRADYPSQQRWIADMSEAVSYIKSLGFSRVIIMGHSLGVAAAMYATKAIPDKVNGLILLSGGYKSREGVREPLPLMSKVRILASSIFRPSRQVVEYYRDGMTGIEDPLFNFRYTLRFIRMVNVEELQLPAQLNIPVLLGVGDKDELFTVESVKEVYEDVPGDKKAFLVLADTYHARFPDESWQKLVDWLDENY